MPKNKKKKNRAPDYLNYPDDGKVEVTYPNGEVKTMTFAEYLNSPTSTNWAWKMMREAERLFATGKRVPMEGKPCETVRFLAESPAEGDEPV